MSFVHYTKIVGVYIKNHPRNNPRLSGADKWGPPTPPDVLAPPSDANVSKIKIGINGRDNFRKIPRSNALGVLSPLASRVNPTAGGSA